MPVNLVSAVGDVITIGSSLDELSKNTQIPSAYHKNSYCLASPVFSVEPEEENFSDLRLARFIAYFIHVLNVDF